jgi:membrane protein
MAQGGGFHARGPDGGTGGDWRGGNGAARPAPRDHELGRDAAEPSEIPSRGWWQILKRTASEVSRDNISLVAAGVAFYALLAIPPALAAAIALWGFFASPADVQQQLSQLTAVLPADAAATFEEQLRGVASKSSETLGWTAVLGFLLSLWSARLAVSAMIGALNIVYEEQERRGFVKLAAISVLLTLAVLAGGLVTLLLVAGVPAVLELVGLGDTAEVAVHVLRWVALCALVLFGLAVLYRLGPSRRQARWQWVSWGAAAATLLWLVASAGFSLFVANFGSYGETYGAIGGVVVLLTWLWISAFVALVGAELNSEMEHQTARDTTVGGSRPLGERDAWSADHVAEER